MCAQFVLHLKNLVGSFANDSLKVMCIQTLRGDMFESLVFFMEKTNKNKTDKQTNKQKNTEKHGPHSTCHVKTK